MLFNVEKRFFLRCSFAPIMRTMVTGPPFFSTLFNRPSNPPHTLSSARKTLDWGGKGGNGGGNEGALKKALARLHNF